MNNCQLTASVRILTGMMAGMTEAGGLIVNPFYHASRTQVLEHLAYAKQVYKSVWRHFLLVCFQGRHVDPDAWLPPRSWVTLEV